MKRKTAVIIGGGLGGLATALRLGAEDWNVSVCEQGATFGGKMNLWERDGFKFDTGPSLITMPWVFENLFSVADKSLKDFVELVPMNPICDYVFADETRLTYTTNLPEWLAALRRIEPRDVDGFFRFMELGAKLFSLSRETFFRQTPFAKPDLHALKALRHLPLKNAWGNYHQAVTTHFRSPHLIQLFDRYPTYIGSSPYKTPATLLVIPYIEYAFGGWHIKGGLYKLVQSILKILDELNVTLKTNARVEKIEHDGRRVRGVELEDGTKIKADVVVMNGDASTANKMLGLNAKPQKTSARSLSGFVMLAGVKKSLTQFSHHTVYFSSNYEREFSELFEERKFPYDPTVYVCIPSRSDSSLAPENCETVFIMANAPANDTWTNEQTTQAKERVFERLRKMGFPDIESDTVVSDVWTPDRIAKDYLMPGGAIYGTHSHGWRNAFLRPPNKDKKIGGLYYVGGSTHPGGGTPTVLMSAEIVCNLIKKYE